METKDMKGHSDCGGCGHGMNGMCGHGHWGHIIIKILVAIFIFWCGVQFGELKGILHGGNSYGFRMMGAYGDSTGQNYFYGGVPGGMMSGWSRGSVIVESATTTKK